MPTHLALWRSWGGALAPPSDGAGQGGKGTQEAYKVAQEASKRAPKGPNRARTIITTNSVRLSLAGGDGQKGPRGGPESPATAPGNPADCLKTPSPPMNAPTGPPREPQGEMRPHLDLLPRGPIGPLPTSLGKVDQSSKRAQVAPQRAPTLPRESTGRHRAELAGRVRVREVIEPNWAAGGGRAMEARAPAGTTRARPSAQGRRAGARLRQGDANLRCPLVHQRPHHDAEVRPDLGP
eukprot:9314894-Pyramimonas_sp.AAC.1